MIIFKHSLNFAIIINIIIIIFKIKVKIYIPLKLSFSSLHFFDNKCQNLLMVHPLSF